MRMLNMRITRRTDRKRLNGMNNRNYLLMRAKRYSDDMDHAGSGDDMPPQIYKHILQHQNNIEASEHRKEVNYDYTNPERILVIY